MAGPTPNQPSVKPAASVTTAAATILYQNGTRPATAIRRLWLVSDASPSNAPTHSKPAAMLPGLPGGHDRGPSGDLPVPTV